MAMDPRQVVAMQQALMGGLGVGMPGAYGAVPQAFGGLFQPQRVPITPEQLGIPPNPPPRLPGETLFGWLGRVSRLRNPQFGQQLGPGLGNVATLPFQVDPLAAYGGQLARQGFSGGLLQPQSTFGQNQLDLLRRFRGFPPRLLRPGGSIINL
jgi:hypothetical protein